MPRISGPGRDSGPADVAQPSAGSPWATDADAAWWRGEPQEPAKPNATADPEATVVLERVPEADGPTPPAARLEDGGSREPTTEAPTLEQPIAATPPRVLHDDERAAAWLPVRDRAETAATGAAAEQPIEAAGAAAAGPSVAADAQSLPKATRRARTGATRVTAPKARAATADIPADHSAPDLTSVESATPDLVPPILGGTADPIPAAGPVPVLVGGPAPESGPADGQPAGLAHRERADEPSIGRLPSAEPTAEHPVRPRRAANPAAAAPPAAGSIDHAVPADRASAEPATTDSRAGGDGTGASDDVPGRPGDVSGRPGDVSGRPGPDPDWFWQLRHDGEPEWPGSQMRPGRVALASAAPARVGRPPSRRDLPPEPRRPATGLPTLVLLSLLAAFFAWVSAEPMWLALGHGDRGTATVTRCTGDGVWQRCLGTFTADRGSFTAPEVSLLGVAASQRSAGTVVEARMVDPTSRQAFAASDAVTVHLRWTVGLLVLLLCGFGIALATGARRLPEPRARRRVLLASVAAPLLLFAGFLAAAY